MKKNRQNEITKFTTLENHFLNTFFSGFYLSSSDLINIGKEEGINLQMNPRELVIKSLLNEADREDKLTNITTALIKLIDDRTSSLHRLSMDYPGALEALSRQAQKVTSSKSILARELRGSVYER
ncbi:MAG: hypothetical protein GQ570_01105 [Helicobacteraceae bacterium]|nr:hypothetical protein [Helicobacteraceae bacterium]